MIKLLAILLLISNLYCSSENTQLELVTNTKNDNTTNKEPLKFNIFYTKKCERYLEEELFLANENISLIDCSVNFTICGSYKIKSYPALFLKNSSEIILIKGIQDMYNLQKVLSLSKTYEEIMEEYGSKVNYNLEELIRIVLIKKRNFFFGLFGFWIISRYLILVLKEK